MSAKTLLTAALASVSLAGVAAAQTAPAARATPATKATPATPATPAAGGASATPAAPATPASPAAPAAAPTGDLVATAQAAGTFSTLLKAADLTKLTPVLKGPGPITVFAPTDAAFAALPPAELEALMTSPARLQRLLLGHVVNTKVTAAQFAGTTTKVPSGAGPELSLDGSGSTPTVNGVPISKADVLATNGVIHVIDRIIMPASAAAPASASTTTAPTNP